MDHKLEEKDTLIETINTQVRLTQVVKGSLVEGDEVISVDSLDCVEVSTRDVCISILDSHGLTVRLKVFRVLIKTLIKDL